VDDDVVAASPDAVLLTHKRLRRPLMVAAPIIVLLGFGYFRLTRGRYEPTADAYAEAARVQISSNVAGRVTEITVRDNQIVHRGDTLFGLDDAPFRIANPCAPSACLHERAAYRLSCVRRDHLDRLRPKLGSERAPLASHPRISTVKLER
jgi:multidrug resistance efflux pump